MNLFGKLITGINFFILLVLFVLIFGEYHVKSIWGHVDLVQLLFFTRVNCGGGINNTFGVYLLFSCLVFPLFLTVSILLGFHKFRKEGNCFFPKYFAILYVVVLSYIAERYYNYDYKELFVVRCILGILFIINLRCCYTPVNVLLSLLIFMWGIFSYLGEAYLEGYKELFEKEISNIYAKNYVAVPYDLKNEKKRNVIILFLESFNEKFRQADNQLEVDDSDAVRFSNFIEGYAQRWTQGALFSAFTGTHIHYISHYYRYAVSYRTESLLNQYNVLFGNLTNDVGELFDFDTPHIVSLGKLSARNGYSNLFVQGSNLDFSGSRKFLLHHGFLSGDIYGYDELLEISDMKHSKDNMIKCFPDDMVYSLFREKINRLDKNRPFLAVMFTMDLHVNHQEKREDFIKKHRQAVQQLNDFIDWFKKQDFYDNTTLVVVGDHNRMGKNVVTGGKIYNAFFNLPEYLKQNLNTERTFNQIDMFPTLLEIMGYSLPERRAGMGVSLFSHHKTLAEEFSYAEQEKIFNGLDRFYYELWQNE